MSGLEQRIHDAVHGQTQPTVTVLSSLLAVEDELGYIPKESFAWASPRDRNGKGTTRSSAAAPRTPKTSWC